MAGLELRVHGVSGTPPQDLLDRPLVEQVGGDATAGFYVPRSPAERTDAAPSGRFPTQPDPPELVGYSWGGLTSGSAGRAFWLVLLPFTFLNIAPRARPDGPSEDPGRARRLVWLIWYLSRVLALAATLLFTLGGVGVGVDLLAWQCAGAPVTPADDPPEPAPSLCSRSVPGWIATQQVTVEGMLLIGALVPVAMLLALGKVSSRTASRYERTAAEVGLDTPAIGAGTAADTNELEVGLGSPVMWQNEHPVRRLRAVHLQGGFAVILASVLAPTHLWPLAAGPALVGLYALVALGCRTFTGHGRSPAWRVASCVAWAALVLPATAATLVLATRETSVRQDFLDPSPGGPRTGAGGLPFFDLSVLAVSAAAVGLLGLLTLVVAVAAWWPRTEPAAAGQHQRLAPGLGGLTCPALAALGVFLGAAFTAGIYVYAAAFLHTGSLKPSFRAVSTIYDKVTVPPTVAVATLAYTYAIVALLVLTVIVVVVVLAGRAKARRYGPHVRADYLQAGEGPEAEARARQIRRDMYLGALVDGAPWVIGPLVLIGTAVVGWAGWYVARHASDRIQPVFDDDGGWTAMSFGAGVGAYLVVATLLGLVGLGGLAFRVPTTRRSVGILWDIASFWPRHAHPLAPPCYAERAVPDLVTFLTHQRLAHPDRAVVLAAHSQGTVISAATLLQLAAYDSERGPDARVLPRVGFLSFGCVLRRLYGRYFPVYFGPARLAALQQELQPSASASPRWINLWRYTDYLGGQVTAGPPQELVPTRAADPAPPAKAPTTAPTTPPATGPVDWEWHAPDPPRFDRDGGFTTFSAPQRHSNFWADESGYFQLAVQTLVQRCENATGMDP